MTIPMLLLLAVVVIATGVGIWAIVHEHDEAAKARRRARVWEARAHSAKQNGREQADERARLSAMTLRPLSEQDLAQFRSTLRRIRVRYVDDPTRAVAEADQLVSAIMHALGVPAWTLQRAQAT